MKAKTGSEIVFALSMVVLFFSLCATLAQVRVPHRLPEGSAMEKWLTSMTLFHPS